MSEDNESDRAEELAKASEMLARQIAPAIQASGMLARQMEPAMQAHERWRRQFEPIIQAHERWRRQMEPMIQAFERMGRQMEPILRAHEAYLRQVEQIFRGNEALRRQAEQIAQAMEQLARCASSPKIGMGLGLLRLAGAMDTSMRELLSPGSAEVTVAGGLALSPTVFVSREDAATASEGESPDVRGSRRLVLAGLSAGQIFILVLVWLIVLVIPAAAWDANLPPDIQALVDVYDGVLANVAVAITFEILGKRKKR